MKGIHGGDIYRNQIEMDFSVNVNPLGLPHEIKASLYEAVEHCSEYPDIKAEKLYQAVSSMLKIPEEYLVFGNGASELFVAIVHAIKPKKTVIPVPSFYGYEYAAGTEGGEVIYYPLKEENGYLPDEVFLQMLTEDTDLLFLANPNNPTGKLMNVRYLKQLLDICREKRILVVLDECFIEFCKEALSVLSKIEEYDNLLLVRAFTKIFAIPGVRLGYLICSNKKLLESVKRQLPEWNLSIFAQAAGCSCTKQKAFICKTVDYIRKERLFLTEELKKMGLCVLHGEANFILIYSKEPLYEKLLEKGILIRDCENFRGLSKGYCRIAIKSHQDNERLLEAIGELI